MPFAQKLKNLKWISVFLIFTAIAPLLYLHPHQVIAASYTWDGGGTDGTCGGNAGDGNKWSCAANWSSDLVPAAGDTVTFDATSTKNATIDASFQGTVSIININSGYTGTITQARSFTVSSTFTQSNGTFTAANQSLTVSGSFILNTGATFTASSGTSTFSSTFTISSGATFNHNSGTVTFNSTLSGTISCGNKTFNLVVLNYSGNIKVVNSDCTLPLGANPTLNITPGLTLNGTLTGSGTITSSSTLTMNTGSVLSGFSTLNTFGLTFNGGSMGSITSFIATSTVTVAGTWNAGSFTTFDLEGAFLLNSGGVFTAPSGTATFGSTFTISSGSTFNHNSGTVTFDSSNSGAISCNNVTFNRVVLNYFGNIKVVNSDCTLPLGASPTINISPGLTLNGTLSGTGTLTSNSTLTMNSGSALSGFTTFTTLGFTNNGGNMGSISSFSATSTVTVDGTWNAGSFTTFDLEGAFLLNSSGVFTAPSGNATFGSTFTINSAATFNHNNGTVTFDSSNSGTISCGNKTFNLVVLNYFGNIKVVSSDCSLPLGVNPAINISPGLTLNGTLSGSGTITSNSTLTMNSGSLSGFSTFNTLGFIFNGGSLGSITSFTATSTVTVAATWNASAYTTFSLGSTFTLNSGANFTAPSAGITFPGVFTMSAGSTFTASSGTMNFNSLMTINGGTFNHNNGIINFNTTITATLTCNGATFNRVMFTHTSGTKTVSANCTFPLGNNPRASLGGSVILNGTLSGTGTLGWSAGTLTLNSGSSLSGFTGVNGSVFVYNSGASIGSITNLTMTSSTTLGVSFNPNTFTTFIPATLIISGGTFTSPSPNYSLIALTVNSGATFIAPTGTLTIKGNFLLNSGSTYNNNGGILDFNLSSANTILCNNTTFNLVKFSSGNGTLGVSSDCNLPVGNNPEFASHVNVSGTLTGTGTLTVHGELITNAGSTLTCFTAIYADNFRYEAGSFGCGGGATHTWNGAGTDGTCGGNVNDGKKWSCAANWSDGNVPGPFDTVIFDSTSTKNSTIDPAFQGNVLIMNVNSGYTGTITQARSIKIVKYTQSAGTFTGSSDAITIDHTFTLNSGATFTSTSGTFTDSLNFTINTGAVFNHNNGTIQFRGTDNATFACANSTFYFVVFNTVSSKTINSDCTFPLGNNPAFGLGGSSVTLNGTLTGTGTITAGMSTLTLGSTGSLSGFSSLSAIVFTNNGGNMGSITSLTATSTVTVAGTWNAGNYTTWSAQSLTLNSGANFTAPSGTMSLSFTYTAGAGSTFNHNNGTVDFNGTLAAAGTITCSGTGGFNLVTFTHTQGNKTISSNCTIPVGNNPVFIGAVTLNGSITGTGTLTANDNFTMNTGSSLNCFTSITANPFIYNGGSLGCLATPLSHTWTGAGTDGTCGGNAGDGNKWSCAANWNDSVVPGIYDSVTFNGTSTKNVTIDPAFQGTISTLTITSAYTGTITQSRNFVVSGAYVQSGGIFLASSNTLSINGTFTLNSGATFTGSSGKVTVYSTFTLNSGATFTAPSGTLNVAGAFTLNSGSTFNHNNGTVNFDPLFPAAALTCNNNSFNLVTFKYDGPATGTVTARTVSADCTLPLGNNPVIEASITNSGILNGTGTFYTGYTVNIQLGGQFTGFTGFDSIIGPSANTTGSLLTVGVGASFDASNYSTFILGGNLTVNAGGIFKAPSNGTISVGRTFSIAVNGTYIHNNAVVIMTDPQVAAPASIFGISCPSNANLNKVIFNNTTTTKIIQGANGSEICTVPLGNNPTLSGPVSLGISSATINVFKANLTGSGTLTVTAPFTHTYAGTLSGFDNAIFTNTYSYTSLGGTTYSSAQSSPAFSSLGKLTLTQPMTFNNTFNGGQLPEIDATNVTFSGGTFTAPASLKLSGNWSHSGGTFSHNNGTVEFTGTTDKTITGNTTFNNLKYAPYVDPTLSFAAGSTQTVLGTLTLKGQVGEFLILNSSNSGNTWNIDLQGSSDVEFVKVSDSTVTTNNITVGCDSVDDGNNTGWIFGGGCSPIVSNLGPTQVVSGSIINDDQPTFTFDISDPDLWDTVKYTIEIDNNSDFSSPEVCYTSGFAAQGSFSFTVGQAEGDGSYSCGQAGQYLDEGTYFVRVLAVDFENHTSDYLIANDGNFSFFVFQAVESPIEEPTETPGTSTCTTVKALCPKTIKVTKPLPTNNDSQTPETENPGEEGKLPDTGTKVKPKSNVLYFVLCTIPPLAVLGFMAFVTIKDKKRKKNDSINLKS